MSRTSIRYQLCILILVSSAFLRSSKLAVAETPKLQSVLKAWQERQDSTKAVRVEWIAEHTELKGSMNDLARLSSPTPLPAGDLPPEDITTRAVCRILVSGIRSRYSFDGQIWQIDKGQLVPRKTETAFDGMTFVEFQKEIGDDKYNQAVTRKSAVIPQLRAVRPISWFFWPLRPDAGGFTADKLSLAEDVGEMNGRSYAIVFEQTKSDTNRDASWELWVEPGNGYRIYRAYYRNWRGKVEQQFDVDYAAKGDGAISKWRRVVFLGNRGPRTSSATVRKITLNPEVAESDLSIDLPRGTRLFENGGVSGKPTIVE